MFAFIKRVDFYKEIGFNIGVLWQTAYLVINPIKVNNFAYLFDWTTVGLTLDWMTELF